MRKYLLILALIVVSVSTVANAQIYDYSRSQMERDHAQAQNNLYQQQILRQQQQANNLLMRQEQREFDRINEEDRREFQQKLDDNFYGKDEHYRRLKDN